MTDDRAAADRPSVTQGVPGSPASDRDRDAERESASDRDRDAERESASDRDDARGDRSGPPGPDAGPDGPTGLPGSSWKAALRRTAREFQEDGLNDWAAALTYYSVLSIFPGLLVLVSLLGLLGSGTVDEVQRTMTEVVPNQEIREILTGAIGQVRASGGTASLVAIFGLLVAFWSASRYVAAFMRASNAIYEVPEGRPIWKTLPIRLGVTAVIGLMLLASALIVVFTGRLAERAGALLGVGQAAVTAWDIAKWPVLLLLVSLMFAILYWASPNARQGGFRWISPGGVVAVVIWLLVSAGFAFYVANFGSYNKTYGTLAGVIVFLVWLWLTNLAILLGAELDAELDRGRAIAAGHPVDKEPFLQLRDDRKLRKRDRKQSDGAERGEREDDAGGGAERGGRTEDAGGAERGGRG